MLGEIIGSLKLAKSFGEIELYCHNNKLDLHNFMLEEAKKVYVARGKEPGGSKWKYFLVRNPALMTYQSYNGATTCVRQKPTPIGSSEGAKYFDEVEEEIENKNSGGIW